MGCPAVAARRPHLSHAQRDLLAEPIKRKPRFARPKGTGFKADPDAGRRVRAPGTGQSPLAGCFCRYEAPPLSIFLCYSESGCRLARGLQAAKLCRGQPMGVIRLLAKSRIVA